MTTSDDSSRASEDDTFRQRVYEVRENSELSVREKFNQLLSLGCEYLDVPNGHIKRIDKRRGVHDVIASVGEEGYSIEVGDQHAHATTFCRRTIELDSPLAISHSSEQGWEDDPAYHEHGLECYLGATINVSGTTYGTVCFVSRTAHSRAFSPSERAFVELVAGIVGTELTAKRHKLKLTDRERLNAVLNRVLRHNLRNSMNIVGGYAGILTERLDGEDQELARQIGRTADTLTELGEKARKLEKVAQSGSPPEELELGPILADITDDLQDIRPDTQIDIAVPESQPVVASTHLEAALYELGENAIIHSDSPPVLDVRVDAESKPDDWVVIEFNDEGPGLPKMEQNILRGRMETQLEHGQGLGLWFVYWTVVSSGGKLTVTVDDGTTVRVWLHTDEISTDDLQQYLDLPTHNDVS